MARIDSDTDTDSDRDGRRPERGCCAKPAHATRAGERGHALVRRRCRRTRVYAIVAAAGLAAALFAASPAVARTLRVCADPNNLPFSNARGEGFENRIAELIAADLGAELRYTWWAQRRGFLRNTLRAGACDVVIGIPSSVELVLATRPYYRSTYVFVTRAGVGPVVRSLDDPVLRTARIGVHVIGDDYANPPPAHALANRGIVQTVRGYSIYGDYREPDPPARLIEAVARGDIDVAIAWGPLAGYFAGRQPVALALAPVTPAIDLPFLPMVFDIGMGVRRGEEAWRDELDTLLVRRRGDIDAILDAYHVPLVGRAPGREDGKQCFGIQTANGGRIVIFAGGIPLKRGGTVVGAIGVSGGFADQHQQVAEAGAGAF